jgi:glycosyltransferase involved in cell wall biosynthesis
MSPGSPAKTLTITSVDPPTEEDRPAVSVIIPTSAEDGPSEGLLGGLAEQDFDRTFEVICVDLESPQETLERWRGSKIRVVSVRGPQPNQGVVLNAGAAAARGRILVFTSANAIPANDRWLAQLVAPFDHDDAPAAVQGGITAQLIDGAPAHNPSFTRESVGWREAYGGLEFSTVNAAMPRKVWEHFPFPPRVLLADRAWQRIAADHELLILPCLAAAVRLVQQDTAGDLVRASMDEGRAWRSLGIRYTALECWADAVRARPLIGEGGEPTAAVARGHKIFRIFRPIGIYLGNRFKTS